MPTPTGLLFAKRDDLVKLLHKPNLRPDTKTIVEAQIATLDILELQMRRIDRMESYALVTVTEVNHETNTITLDSVP